MSDMKKPVRTLAFVVVVFLWLSTLFGWALMFGGAYYFLLAKQYLYSAILFAPFFAQTLILIAGFDEIVSLWSRWFNGR